MKHWTFESVNGVTSRVTLEDETYVIINHKGQSSEAIEIDFKKRLIKIYDGESWTILPMDREQQFDSDARLIENISELL